MSSSKYYRYKNKAEKIIANADQSAMKKSYTRVGEQDLRSFEEHLKLEIAARSRDAPKWTFPLLTALANIEREKEPFVNMDAFKKYTFSDNY